MTAHPTEVVEVVGFLLVVTGIALLAGWWALVVAGVLLIVGAAVSDL